MSMLLLALAAATIAVDPSAAAAVDACVAQASESRKLCDSEWRGIRLRLDAALKGTLRVNVAGHGAAWATDCPYDVVRHSGACALVLKDILFVQPYRSDIPAIVWGDRNADRRERMIRFDGGRSASWTDKMSEQDIRAVVTLLEQSRRATFSWRASRAKVLSATTIDLTGFADLRLLLTAMTQAAAHAYATTAG